MSNLPIAPAAGTHLVVGAGEVGSAIATLLADAGVDVILASRRGRGPEHDLDRARQRPPVRLGEGAGIGAPHL